MQFENLELDVSRETLEKLNEFRRLFEKWAKSINLVAPSTLGDIWNRHIVDSAQIFALRKISSNWVDLGSGGGFPGIITAILQSDFQEAGQVHLIESNQKKCAFLRVAIQELGLSAVVHPKRIEVVGPELSNIDAISGRALIDLTGLLSFSRIWMENAPNVRAYFHKGRDYEREIEKANSDWSFDLITHKSVVEADSVILEISNLSRK